MACTSSCATLIILLVTCGSVLSIGGFHSWKVGTLFEGLLEGLGVKIRPDAFSAGFEIETCDLQYSGIHDDFHRAFRGLEFGNSSQVKAGLVHLSRAVRELGRAAITCGLTQISEKLQEAAADLGIILNDEVSACSREGGLQTLSVNGANLTQLVLEATRSWYSKKYANCGKVLAKVTVQLAGPIDNTPAPPEIRTMEDYWKQMSGYNTQIREAEARIQSNRNANSGITATPLNTK